MSTQSRPRPLALGIFRSGDRIFVTKAYDRVKDQIFYRPLGGVIEFGERGAETVARELKEEIGADVAAQSFPGASPCPSCTHTLRGASSLLNTRYDELVEVMQRMFPR